MSLDIFALCLFSVASYYLLRDVLHDPFGFVLSRVPEFALGMLIYYKRSQILENKHKLVKYTSIFVLAIAIFRINEVGWLRFGDTFFPLHPISFIMTLPLLLLFYIFAENINRKINLSEVNSYSKYLYVSMLTQHIVIREIMSILPYQQFSKFGYVFGFVFILIITVCLSKFIVECSKQIENKMINIFAN